jgi:hypothetical protein
MPNHSDSTPPQLDTLYREYTTQLRFMKRQQWAITNYLLLLLGGLYGIAHTTFPEGGMPVWALCAAETIVIVSTVVALWLLALVQQDMDDPRDRLLDIHKRWEAAHGLGLPKTKTEIWSDLPFLRTLRAVCFGGGVIVAVAIYIRFAAAA